MVNNITIQPGRSDGGGEVCTKGEESHQYWVPRQHRWCEHKSIFLKMVIVDPWWWWWLLLLFKSHWVQRQHRWCEYIHEDHDGGSSYGLDDNDYDWNHHFVVSKVWEEFVREYKRTGQLLVELGSGSSHCRHCRHYNNDNHFLDPSLRVIKVTHQI